MPKPPALLTALTSRTVAAPPSGASTTGRSKKGSDPRTLSISQKPTKEVREHSASRIATAYRLAEAQPSKAPSYPLLSMR